MTNVLEAASATLGLLGTALMVKPSRFAPWGFVAWLISNPCAMALMFIQGQWWLFAQFTVYWVLALVAVWNWLVKPMLAEMGRGA